MKKHLLAFVLLFIFKFTPAQIANPLWYHQLEGPNYDTYDEIVVMDNKDIITYGLFSGVIDMNPAKPGTNVLDAGRGHNFFTRITADGDLVWAVCFDSSANLTVRKMARDAAGDIYICGDFIGTADMDPTDDTLYIRSVAGMQFDVFFAKYSGTNGHLLWAKTMSSPQNDILNSIGADASGNVVIAGHFRDNMDMDAGAGIFYVPSGFFGSGGIARYDAQGNFINAYNFGVDQGSNIHDLVFDSQNNLYICGGAGDTIDYDLGAGVYNLNPGGVLIKYNSSFQLVHAAMYRGTTTNCSLKKLIIDTQNHLTISGSMGSGSVDFDASGDTAFVYVTASLGIFITRQDTALQYLDAFALKSNTASFEGIAADMYGNAYGMISFSGNNFDADPGSGTAIYHATSLSSDLLLVKYSPSGQLLWSAQIGNGGDDRAGGIAIGRNNKLYAIAYFISVLDIDPGPGQITLIDNQTQDDAYIIAFEQCNNPTITVNPVICKGQSYIIANDTLTESGNYVKRFNTANNCDSVVNVHLTVTNPLIDICVSDTIIMSEATGTVTYQWINCTTNTPVAGAISQAFNVPDNNPYAVEITQNGCTVKSTCMQVYQKANKMSPQFEWAHLLPYYRYYGNRTFRVGKTGNLYVAGEIDLTADFSLLHDTTHILTSTTVGPYTSLVKYDENRNYVWGFSIGSNTVQFGDPMVTISAMVLDDDENVYIAGQYHSAFDIDPGPGFYNMTDFGIQGVGKGFVAKFNSAGQLLWANVTHTPGGQHYFKCLFLDKSGHIYSGGSMAGTLTLLTANGTTTFTNNGFDNILLFQFDALTGGYNWHFSPTISGIDEHAITGGACDHDGNIIITGAFQNTINFNMQGGTSNLTPFLVGSPDAFIVKYTPQQQLLWARKRNIQCSELGYTNYNVVVDCDNNIYAGGSGYPAWIVKYDSAGNFSNPFPNFNGDTQAKDLAMDEAGDLYLLWELSGTVNIGFQTSFAANPNSANLMFSKFSTGGTLKWGAVFGSTGGGEEGASIDVDRKGNIYISGRGTDTLDMDASAATYYLYPEFFRHAFIAKYGQSCAPVDTAVLGDTLHLAANDTNSYYQWIYCSNGAIIPGANGPTLPPTYGGYVQLIIYQGSCIDTSACHYAANAIGIEEIEAPEINLYPNPVSGEHLTIVSNKNLKQVELLNLAGEKLLEQNLPGNQNTFHIRLPENLQEGLYLLKLTSLSGTAVYKKFAVISQ